MKRPPPSVALLCFRLSRAGGAAVSPGSEGTSIPSAAYRVAPLSPLSCARLAALLHLVCSEPGRSALYCSTSCRSFSSRSSSSLPAEFVAQRCLPSRRAPGHIAHLNAVVVLPLSRSSEPGQPSGAAYWPSSGSRSPGDRAPHLFTSRLYSHLHQSSPRHAEPSCRRILYLARWERHRAATTPFLTAFWPPQRH